jgi:hypothetical protein
VPKLSERQRVGVTIGASVLLAGGITALVFLDRKDIEDTEANIARLDQKIQAAEVEIRKTKEREDKVIVYREVAPRELGILPQKQQIADYFASLASALSQTGVRLTKVPDSAPKESELAKGVYVTANTIECDGDAASFLRLVNTIENDERLSTITGFKVKGGQRVKEGEKAPVHKVVLNLETYFYAPPTKGTKEVPIANVDARLEDPKIRKEIAEFTPEKQETYFLRPSASRRDVFVDFRKDVVVEDPELVRRRHDQETQILSEIEQKLDEIREKVEVEKAWIARGDLFGADRVRQEIDTLLNDIQVRVANVVSVKSVTFPDLLTKLEKAKRSTEEIKAGRRTLPRELTVTVGVAQMTRDRVKAAFESGDFAEVNSICSMWEAFLRGKAIDPAAEPLIAEIKEYRIRGKKLSEFHQKSIKVTGIIFIPTQPSQSAALINSAVVRMGEKLFDGQIEVVGISRDEVTFSYQGEKVRVRRQDATAKDAPAKDGKPATVGASVPVPSAISDDGSGAAPRRPSGLVPVKGGASDGR